MHCLFFQTDANLTSALVQKQEAEKHPCNHLLNSLHTQRCEQMPKQEAEKHPCKLLVALSRLTAHSTVRTSGETRS
jgi:hypothetical protein